MLPIFIFPLALGAADPFTGASLPCSMAEDLIDVDGQGMRSEYWLTCRVPAAVGAAVKALDTPTVLARASSGPPRLAAMAALYIEGRFPEVPAADRMRFALDLAVQEHEPFASTSVIFLDAADPGPDAPFRGRAGADLGWLPWPWQPEMTAVVREFLQPGRVSTLATWYAQVMGDRLEESARPDLQRVAADADTLEASFATQAIAHLDAARALREGPFVAAERLGLAVRSGRGCVVLQVAGSPPAPGTSVHLVDAERAQWAQVVESPDCLDAGRHDQAALQVYDPWPEPGHSAAAIVAPRAVPGPGADLDGDGRPDTLAACQLGEVAQVALAGPNGAIVHRALIANAESDLPACEVGER